MLRSPLASARLPPSSSTLAPSHGRPRSRTAPSTPLVEAPTHTLVELPGSIPDRPRASYHHSYDSKLRQTARTYSHMKRPSHPWLHLQGDHKTDAPDGDRRKTTPPQYTQPSTPHRPGSEGFTGSTRRCSKPPLHTRRIWSDPIQSHGMLRPTTATPQTEITVDRHLQPSSTPRPAVDESRLSYENSTQSFVVSSHESRA